MKRILAWLWFTSTTSLNGSSACISWAFLPRALFSLSVGHGHEVSLEDLPASLAHMPNMPDFLLDEYPAFPSDHEDDDGSEDEDGNGALGYVWVPLALEAAREDPVPLAVLLGPDEDGQEEDDDEFILVSHPSPGIDDPNDDSDEGEFEAIGWPPIKLSQKF